MRIKFPIALIIVLLLFVAQQCKNIKEVTKETANLEKSVTYEEFLKRIPTQSFDTSILIRDVDIRFQEGESVTRIQAILKFIPQKGILASLQGPLNIEIARIYVTEDSLKIIDRINKTYMSGPFEELIAFMRFPFNYNDLPDILFNRYKAHLPDCKINPQNCSYLFELTEEETFHYSYMDERLCFLDQNRYRSVFDYHLYYNAFTYKPIQRALWDKRSHTRLNVKYNGEILLDQKYAIPENLKFSFSRNGKQEIIQINYNKAELSHNRLNFQVPKSYKRKKLTL